MSHTWEDNYLSSIIYHQPEDSISVRQTVSSAIFVWCLLAQDGNTWIKRVRGSPRPTLLYKTVTHGKASSREASKWTQGSNPWKMICARFHEEIYVSAGRAESGCTGRRSYPYFEAVWEWCYQRGVTSWQRCLLTLTKLDVQKLFDGDASTPGKAESPALLVDQFDARFRANMFE